MSEQKADRVERRCIKAQERLIAAQDRMLMIYRTGNLMRGATAAGQLSDARDLVERAKAALAAVSNETDAPMGPVVESIRRLYQNCREQTVPMDLDLVAVGEWLEGQS